MKQYPALDIRTESSDLLLALVDDFRPTALEERDALCRIFFSTASDRDEALRALAATFDVTAIDVSDEDWARRSQDSLKPITVGRVIVSPPWASRNIGRQPMAIGHERSAVGDEPLAISHEPSAIELIILPSMGFGTGHHVTTRLCLAALQTIDLTGCTVLDVGTGSGVLAIAACCLGASEALGIDDDPDAIQSARDNAVLNPDARHVTFETIDLAARALPLADVVTANLTGALLVRSADALLAALRSGGLLILSGIQTHERDEVGAAFANTEARWERDEDGWIGLAVKKR